MKKAILLALGAIFVISAFGCGPSDEDKASGPPPADAKSDNATNAAAAQN